MSLTPDQEKMWRTLESDFGPAPEVDFRPLTLEVGYIIESEVDLLEAIAANIAERRLPTEEADRLHEFFTAIHDTENPDAIIAELPYQQLEGRPLELILTFPARGGDYGQA